MRKLVFLVMVFLVVGMASATVWNPAPNGIYPPGTGNWEDAANWTDGVPTADATAFFVVPGAADCDVNATNLVNRMVQGDGGPGGVLRIKSGAKLTTGATWSAVGYNNTGHMIVEGAGTMTFGQHAWIAMDAGAVGTLDIWGTVNVNGMLGVGWNGGTGYVNVYEGGELNLSNIHEDLIGLPSITGSSVLNITGTGQVTLPGDFEAVIAAYAVAGKIVGDGILGNVKTDLTTNSGFTTVTIAAQQHAITSFQPDGTITWTNMSTDCVAVVEEFSPATSGKWVTVHAQLPTSLVSQAQVTATSEHAWFRSANADNANAPTNMVLIPGGANSGTDPDFGVYTLSVESFYMDQYEVTKALWDEVKSWDGGNGYDLAGVGSGKALDHPVHSVSWYDCVKWCNARSEKEGRTPVYYTDAGLTQVYKVGQVSEPHVDASATGYRLPTDEQWEYAARGGVSGRRFPWGGDTIQHARANYYSIDQDSYDTSPTRGYHPDWDDDPEPYTSPVGTFEAGKNGYGLYDMVGNVYELCYDWHPSYPGKVRVFRGGGWVRFRYRVAGDCRVGSRDYVLPGNRYNFMGFRAVLPPGQQ